ncbi:protein artichoke-like [Galleria mellonella]|uniref:Protein artichoke-like n=1 Tax=Galleria mellonella TaxID=7137 RepID=A0ABM3MWT7_GALME|nr:protein artichoke-like [Galleria mellonella]
MTKMAAVYTSFVLIMLLMVSSCLCYCPLEKSYNTGNCSYRFHCIRVIQDIGLPEHCQGSTNYHVKVNVYLSDAIDRFDKSMNPKFLYSITSLRASGVWPQTNLSLIQYMPQLQTLNISGNQIEKITENAFYTLTQLEYLDLSHNRLSDVEGLFEFEMLPNRMRHLNLAHNEIQQIPSSAFENLTSLIELDLSYNLISYLDENSFDNLTNLETLRLNNNNIKNQIGALNALGNLTNLYLSKNEIQIIDDDSLELLKHLVILDVSWNQLDVLTPELFLRHWQHFEGRAVCKILLSENHLTFLPNATSVELMSRFTRHDHHKKRVDVLTKLDLSKNSITTIEYNAFRYLVRLTSLDLSQNKLTNFRVNADDLVYIEYLNLSKNYITQLNLECFLSMNRLQNLDLSNNYIDGIPDLLFINNYQLKRIDMKFNDLKVLENLHIKIFHPDEGILDLSNNAIYKMNIPSGEGMRLKKLMLQSNNISDPTNIDLKHQIDLEHIDMSNNYIQYLNSSSLCLPTNITHLDLSYNDISKIAPATFHKFRQLKTLRLSHNDLTGIEYGIFQGMTSLVYLNLSNNDISYLDSKVFIDLRSLYILSIEHNSMIFLDYKGWVAHKHELKVYIDGNNFTCDWLGTALSDYNNNFSKMRPYALNGGTGKHSLQGIPCVQKEIGELVQIDSKSGTLTDSDRLLAVNLKILEAIKNQTYVLRKFMWHSLYAESKNI